MRKLFPLLAVGILFSGLSFLTAAEKGKEVTITGEGQCAKCSLKETKACQNAVVVDEVDKDGKVVKDGKKTTYYLVKNKVANAFHKNICQTNKQIKVVGTCEKVEGKLTVTATEIEEVK